MIIVDASVWIDFLNQRSTPETQWLGNPRKGTLVGLTTLTLAELLQGIRFENKFRQALAFFDALQVFNPSTREIAVKSTQNFRALRNRGITIRSTVDCLIATYCIEFNHQLLHCDRDFQAFEKHLSLRVLHV